MTASKHREEDVYRAVREGELEIDDQGRIWRVKARHGTGKPGETMVKPCERRRAEHRLTNGYLQIRAKYDGHSYQAQAHRLVWFHFHGHIPEGHEINHKSGIKAQNWPGNLELMTGSENILHAVHVLGTHPTAHQEGEANPAAKLITAEVEEIRRRAGGGEIHRVIALDFEIARSTVSKIARGEIRIHG